MIKMQRSADRRYTKSGSQEMWMTFDRGNFADPFHHGFRALTLLNEVKLLPGTQFKLQSHKNHESVTYVREGSLVVRHRSSKDALLMSGYCHRTNSHRLMITSVSDKFPLKRAHLFVSAMTPHRKEGEPTSERKHYPFADRHGKLRLIASPDGSSKSLRLQKDVRIYTSILDPGHHVVHELSVGRGAWLHVVSGSVRLIDKSLEAGDGASLDDELAVSFTAREASEILLFDLA